MSAAETCRLLCALDEPAAQRDQRLRWSGWRRRHQATARRCHQVRREQRDGPPQETSPPPEQRPPLAVPTEEQWDRILALVRAQDQAAHRPALPQRPIVEGILWVMEHSARWQDIPARFGAWKTIESRYYRWRKRGTWAAILTILSPTSAPHPAPP